MKAKIKSSYSAKKQGLSEEFKAKLKPRPIVDKKLNTIIAWAIFFVTLIIYGLTQARSLSFWDVGEYITCSSILGVPHPPGNPFYIMLGKFITIFSMGINHAFIVNFLSCLFSAFAVMFTYLFTVKFITMYEDDPKLAYIGGIISSLLTAFSFTFWNNAIEAEVYSGLAFIINLIMWMTMIYVEKSDDFSHQNILIAILYIFFLGFGIHQTSLQIAASVLFIVLYPLLLQNVKKSGFWTRFFGYFVALIITYVVFKNIGESAHIPPLPKIAFATVFSGLLYWHMKDKVSNRTWGIAILVVILGLSTHFFLWVRSGQRPFINEGHPNTWNLFMDYILRRQYGVTSFMERRASFWYQLTHHFWDYFVLQFFNVKENPVFGFMQRSLIHSLGLFSVLALGFTGIYRQIKKNKHSFIYYFSFFFMASLAMIFVINLSDKEVRPRDYFFTTAYNLWTFWIGAGAAALIAYGKRIHKGVAIALAVIMLSLPVMNLYTQYFIHDRSREFIALDYGMNLLNGLEENAIIFTNGDNDTFPLWYLQAVEDKYAIEKKSPATNVYPTQKTEKIIAEAMDFKNKELKGIRKDVTIANLSLLNTPWYIKQLRDKEGIEISWSDKQIDRIQPAFIDRDYTVNIKSPNGESFPITIPGNKQGNYTVLQNKDQAVLEIMKRNFGKRPMYFAVTVPDHVFMENNFVNEGMVYRITAKPVGAETGPYGRKTNIEKLQHNIEKVYRFRSIFDDTVYKDTNTRRLIGNYANLFQELAFYYSYHKDYDKALKMVEKASAFLLDKRHEYFIFRLDLLARAERFDDARILANETLKRFPRNLEILYNIITFYSEYKMTDEMIALLKRAIHLDRNNPKPLSYAYQLGKVHKIEAKVIALFEEVKAQNPALSGLDELILDLKKSIKNRNELKNTEG